MEVPQSLIKENVYLGDFGLAMTAGTSVSSKVQSPNVYCAPERFHNIGPSFASDMWSYMCLFAELYLGLVPFHGLLDGAGSTIVISSMVNALGPLPEHWKGNYEGVGAEVDSWYDQGRKPVPRMTLAAKIKRARPEASQTEIKNVLSFMSKGFCYLPESRMSAAELLEDASFKAVMQIGRPCDSLFSFPYVCSQPLLSFIVHFSDEKPTSRPKNPVTPGKEIGGTVTKENKEEDGRR